MNIILCWTSYYTWHCFISIITVSKLIVLKETSHFVPPPSTEGSRCFFFWANMWDLLQKCRSGRLEAIWAPCCNMHAINPELVQPICHTQQSDEASVWSRACKRVVQDMSVHPRYIRLTPWPRVSVHKSPQRHAATKRQWIIQLRRSGTSGQWSLNYTNDQVTTHTIYINSFRQDNKMYITKY